MNSVVILALLLSIAAPSFAFYKFGSHIMSLLAPKDATAEYEEEYYSHEQDNEGFYPSQPVPELPTSDRTTPALPQPAVPQPTAPQEGTHQ